MLKILFIVVLFSLSSNSLSDPHYIQELHPYCFTCGKSDGDKLFEEELKKFKSTVNVWVGHYSDSEEGEMFVYFYIIHKQNAETFTLDLNCPENKAYKAWGPRDRLKKAQIARIINVSVDPRLKNPSPIITDLNEIQWSLDPNEEWQGMWIYSEQEPRERKYKLLFRENLKKANGKVEGTISAPSC